MSGIDQCPPPPQPEQVHYVKEQCVEPRGFYDGMTTQAQISKDRRSDEKRTRARRKTLSPFKQEAHFEQKAMVPPPTTIPTPVPIYTQPPIRIIETTEEEKGENKAPPRRINYDAILDLPTTADGEEWEIDPDAADLRTYPQDGRYLRLVQGRWIQEQTPGQVSGSFKERVLANVQSQPRRKARGILKETRKGFSLAHKQKGTEISTKIADKSKGIGMYRARVARVIKLLIAKNQKATKLDRRDARRGAQKAQEVPLFSQTTSSDYAGSLEDLFTPAPQPDPEELFYERETREAELGEELKAKAALTASKAKYDNWFMKILKDKIHSGELPPEPIERDEAQEVLNAETEAHYANWSEKTGKDLEWLNRTR
ncbi:hypothetical protein HOG17_00065 [Candidatus Peregrinibacteria bacterium]|jgi:hypothetical protein|nr:hypothetical protein [Candidatus Peregrinibacteria bacterium]MBT4147655.1 hypothetical protein [Candidatus Peregrinibacteria bacterium]MBT4366289.1 hypothetical protein [Candidatus Peregrinibacteria bacterium]